jgi:hypothetical protein
LSRNDNHRRLCSSGGQLALQDSDAFGARQGDDAQLGNILHCVSEIRACVHQVALNVTQYAAHAKQLGLMRSASARQLVNSGGQSAIRRRCCVVATRFPKFCVLCLCRRGVAQQGDAQFGFCGQCATQFVGIFTHLKEKRNVKAQVQISRCV